MKLCVSVLSALLLCVLTTPSLFANSILKFEGVYKYQAVLFNWELNPNMTFQLKEIERSSDSINFYNCISLGSSNTKQMAWDKEPLTGKSFYRLKVIDSHGNIEYSSVIMIKVRIWFNWQQKTINDYNTDSQLKAVEQKNESYKILIYDWSGNKKASMELSGIENFDPLDYLYILKRGEPNIFIVLKDGQVIKRQTYYMNM